MAHCAPVEGLNRGSACPPSLFPFLHTLAVLVWLFASSRYRSEDLSACVECSSPRGAMETATPYPLGGATSAPLAMSVAYDMSIRNKRTAALQMQMNKPQFAYFCAFLFQDLRDLGIPVNPTWTRAGSHRPGVIECFWHAPSLGSVRPMLLPFPATFTSAVPKHRTIRSARCMPPSKQSLTPLLIKVGGCVSLPVSSYRTIQLTKSLRVRMEFISL